MTKMTEKKGKNEMRLQEINIRDPYVLVHDKKYYLYGTRAKTCWGKADGFDCYVSDDLKQWEGPFEIFHKSEGFWADQNYWAPECIYYRNQFYLISTFGTTKRKGIQILTADTPIGPFLPFTQDVITPKNWNCIDGSIFIQGDKKYLIFSHSFEDTPDGDMCVVELNDDLTEACSEVKNLFSAKSAPWAKPVPFAEKEFGLSGEVFFTDGPTVHRTESGELLIIWSSWGENGYAVGTAVSESGGIEGPWHHRDIPVFKENGGHGMMFRDLNGELKYALHYPNEKGKEHPLFLSVMENEINIILKDVENK